MASRQKGELAALAGEKWTPADEQRTGPRFDDSREGRGELALACSFHDHNLPSDSTACLLQVFRLKFDLWACPVKQHAADTRLGYKFVQPPRALAGQISVSKDHAREITTRPTKARDQTGPHWIAAGKENDWYLYGCRHSGARCKGITDDHRHPAPHEIGHEPRQPVER